MSLLLQALQKAAKSRDGDTDALPAPAATDLALEPAVPGPRQRQESSAAAPAPAQAATLVQASRTPAFDPIDYAREHYMLTFIGLALVFAIAYGTYVYVQINHPFRSAPAAAPMLAASTPPRAAAPSAPAAPPGTKISGMPGVTAASAGSPTGAASGTASTAAAPAALVADTPAATAKSMPAPAMAAADASVEQSASPATATAAPADNARKSRKAAAAGGAAAPASTPGADADGIETVVIPSSRPPKQSTRDISVRHDDTTAPAVNPTLMQAYEALQGGERTRARELYEQVLQAEPRNLDALLGLGAIALNDGRLDDASRRYQQVLELDPRNSYAQAALISIVGGADPVAAESRLKQLIAREPSAFLYFSLGNLYAQQSLWPSAQQAYFQAFQMQPDNPDYAFNLAIGLEHLGQNRHALEYYRKALELSFKKGHANFDQSLVIQRVGQLSTRVEQ